MVLAGTPVTSTSSDNESRLSSLLVWLLVTIRVPPRGAWPNSFGAYDLAPRSGERGQPSRSGPGRDVTHPPGLEVLEGLLQLGLGVHHKRAVVGHRLADGLPAEHQHLEGRGTRLLGGRRPDLEGVAGSEDGQVAGSHRSVLGAH